MSISHHVGKLYISAMYKAIISVIILYMSPLYMGMVCVYIIFIIYKGLFGFLGGCGA